MPKRRKATNALKKRALKAMKEPVKGAVKALATTVPKKVMGAATTGLGAEAVAQFLKAVAPSSAMGKRLNKALSKDPGKLTREDIARKKKGKAKRGPAPKTKRRGLTRGSEYVAPDKSRVKKFKDRAKKRLKRRK
jgi:hypothetical protein